MALTARQLNRASLERQLLLRRAPITAPDAVRAVLALQAQEPASSYLALWSRVAEFRAADLDELYRSYEVVKATLMRMTLHAVHRDDYPALHHALLARLRSARLSDPRLAAALPAALAFAAEPRSNQELAALLDDRFGPRAENGWWAALRLFTPVVHAPADVPWSFGPRPSYLAAPHPPHDDHAAALTHLAAGYLQAFGPATVADLAGFTSLTRADARAGLESIVGVQRLDGPDGAELFDGPGATVPDARTSAPPRLLPMWDSVLLAYADRTRIVPEEYRRVVTRQNGDTLPTVLVDGYVAGVWRQISDGLEVTVFHPISQRNWQGIGAEARRLARFLRRHDPAVYRRYGHWWDKGLPGVDVRVFSG